MNTHSDRQLKTSSIPVRGLSALCFFMYPGINPLYVALLGVKLDH
jgi:hypothetical protein